MTVISISVPISYFSLILLLLDVRYPIVDVSGIKSTQVQSMGVELVFSGHVTGIALRRWFFKKIVQIFDKDWYRATDIIFSICKPGEALIVALTYKNEYSSSAFMACDEICSIEIQKDIGAQVIECEIAGRQYVPARY